MQHSSANRPAWIRYFQDRDRREWRVFQRQKPSFGGESATVLVFESNVSFRCVGTFPADWRRLSWESLERLSWQT
jgi:hypothetical protein